MDIIFYIGANVGQNLAYYLQKATRVVAVEANPDLTNEMNVKYKESVRNGSLVVLNRCITTLNENVQVDFYVNKYNSTLSTFCKPENLKDYTVIKIQSVNIVQLIRDYGNPDFIKIDVEGLDEEIIKDLLLLNLLPAYLQYENSGSELLRLLINSGKYQSYNIVSFYNFASIYPDHERFEAGSFGSDIKSPWLTEHQIVELTGKMPHSWYDVHLKADPEPFKNLNTDYYKVDRNIKNSIVQFTPDFLLSAYCKAKARIKSRFTSIFL